jgi:polysaccharide biosynthesis protein PslH
MKILYVCHRVPFPPKRGGKIRPFNMIRHLHEQGHEVTVASLARTEAERDEAKGLAEHCQQVMVEVIPDAQGWVQTVLRLPTLVPSSFGYFYSAKLAKRIKVELAAAHYDLIFCHCSSVAPYVEDVVGPKKVLDYGDMDSHKWREYAGSKPFPISAGYWVEAVKLARRERLLSRQFDLCTCTTAAELASLRELGVSTPSDWFPNGVDSSFFAPDGAQYDADQVCFVGRMDYFPNQQAVQTFCRDILPGLRARRPTVKFSIVGADPPEFIRDLAKLSGVTVTGSVPDVRPHVRSAALTVAPLQIARGTQNKILESMAMGVPVVCSPQASGGVDAVAGEHLEVANDADQWVAKVAALLDNKDRRQKFATAARARVISNHSWKASMQKMTTLLEGMKR